MRSPKSSRTTRPFSRRTHSKSLIARLSLTIVLIAIALLGIIKIKPVLATSNTTSLISINSAGTATGNAESYFPTSMTPDGRYVAFYSPASDLTPISDNNGSDHVLQTQQLGVATDKLVPGDYDGDGQTDFAVFRPAEGVWYLLRSFDHVLQAEQWGMNGDVPQPGDYDQDGKADVAV